MFLSFCGWQMVIILISIFKQYICFTLQQEVPLEEKRPRVQSYHHLAPWPQPSKTPAPIILIMVGGVKDNAPVNYLIC